MRVPMWPLLLLAATLSASRLPSALGSGISLAADASAANEERQARGSSGVSPAPAARPTEKKGPSPSVQDFCGGPEETQACDFLRDGVCVISAGNVRVWQRRRWRDGKPQSPPEPRWVEGLRIRTGGDIEVRGALLQCTQAASAREWPAARRRRLRMRGLHGSSRGSRAALRAQGTQRDPATDQGDPFQRIEFCASGSIRLIGAAKLRCTETILFAGDSVAIGEKAEVSASGTVMLRAQNPHALPAREAEISLDVLTEASLRSGSLSPKNVGMWLMGALGVGTRKGAFEGPPGNGAPQNVPAPSPLSAASSPTAPAGPAVQRRGPPEGTPLLAASQEPKLRAGSHGGLGGVASDRCEAKAFSHPLRAPVKARGNIFLPLAKGEAGLTYPSPMGSPMETSSGVSRTALLRQAVAVEVPRGGGLVVIVASRRLAVDGQVTSSGEPGWGCEGSSRGPTKVSPQRMHQEETPGVSRRRWPVSRGLQGLLLWLLGSNSGGTAVSSRTRGSLAATCAAAGSGGSIVLVAETLAFPSSMQSGRVAAAGGGCLAVPPGRGEGGGSASGAPGPAVQGPLEALPGECAAGGGGRIAIFADQPHPLDPVVLASGGCALRSSRLDLLPCLCGGGGTIFSRMHRRLVISNKLTVTAAASPPGVSLATRSQPTEPHAVQGEKDSSYAGDSRAAVSGGGQHAGTLQAISPLKGFPVAGAPTEANALAVLSVQPTPLPVPLYAPSITLAVEAAVVALGPPASLGANGPPTGPQEASTNPGAPSEAPSARESKVVVGSLLLHGGSRGSALHVLTPLHLHAAEGSIRLRQRSSLVLAPCGGSETEETRAHSGGPCSKLPQTGILLGASVVVSSAASVSVGEEAAIRFMPGLHSFPCSGGPRPAVPSPQQGAPESTALGVGLLAGERLLLHGDLGLAAAPSDCLPAPLLKTPLLLFGGREVSLRGEQQLDQLVVLSQGTATLGGSCTVGAPHRCNGKRTPLNPKASRAAGGASRHSTICSALDGYAAAQVSPYLQAAGDEEEVLPAFFFARPHPEEGGPLLAEGDSAGSHSGETGPPPNGENASSSSQHFQEGSFLFELAEGRQKEEAEGEKGWVKRTLKALRLVAREMPHWKDEGIAHFLLKGPEAQGSCGPSCLKKKQLADFIAWGPQRLRGCEGVAVAETGDPVKVLRKVVALEFRRAPLPAVSLRRWKKGLKTSLPPLLGRLAPALMPAPRGPSTLKSIPSLSLSAAPPRVKEQAALWALWPAESEAPSPSWDAGGTFLPALASSGEKGALRSAGQEGLVQAPPSSTPAPSANEGVEAPVGTHAASAAPFLGSIEAFLQGGAPPWAHLDAAIFAREGLVVDSGASLIGGSLLLCGGRGNVVLQGNVEASRRGCQPTHGPGAGSRGTPVEPPAASKEPVSPSSMVAQSTLCGGGGGAHVGFGGDGVHALTGKPCSGSGGVVYGRGGRPAVLPKKSHPAVVAGLNEAPPAAEENADVFASTASASGGGGDLARAGSGGGFVWVQGQTVTVDGAILADGGGAELMQDAIIDIEVDPDNSDAHGSSLPAIPSAAQNKEANTGGAERPSAALSAAEVIPGGQADAISEVACTARASASLPRAASSVKAALPQGEDGEVSKVGKAEGTKQEGTAAGASLSCQLSGLLFDPAQLGQGGGAGGSVIIDTRALMGSGLISAQGGNGGRCTGGGGGGGAIDFLWDASFQKIRGQAQRPAKASSSNALGWNLRGEERNPLPSKFSWDKEPARDDGDAEGESSSVFVPWIRPLDFAAGFSGSLRVGGGGSDPSTACGRLQLPLGQQGGSGEVRSALGCPSGYAGWRCSPCPVGFFSDGKGGVCLSCTNKPSDNAFYTREGVGDSQCPYACTKGLPDASVNPRCLPLFLFLVERLLCCAVLVPLGLLCLAFLGLGALLREVARRLGQQQAWGYGALLGTHGSPMPVCMGGMESGCSSSGFGAASPSGSLAFLGGSNERRLLHLAVPHLTLEDLPFHVFRIYLHGRNSPHSPWGLDGQPPPFLEPLTTPHRFTQFAAAANALCGFSRCFVFVYGLLSFLYPPLAALLLRASRARRADKMVALCSPRAGGPTGVGEGGAPSSSAWGTRGPWVFLASRFGWGQSVLWGWERTGGSGMPAAASFWRSIRARELSFALKFGCDPDCTLGFIDVLDLDRNILDYRCSPQLPLVLLAQGDGRIVPFSLSRGLRKPGASRTTQGPRQAGGKGNPADPLQGSLEEFASSSVWACFTEFFSAKVKEITAEDLGTLRAFLGTAPSAEGEGTQAVAFKGAPEEVGEWMGESPSCGLLRAHPGDRRLSNPFARCGRCGRLQLPSVSSGDCGGGPLGILMGGPLYALRAVARLCEGIRLMSDRLLKPHGIAAAVCLMSSRGFVSRTDGVRRITGSPQEASEGRRPEVFRRDACRPPGAPQGKDSGCGVAPRLIRRREGHCTDVTPPGLRGPLCTGSLLLRAASSPSALLDSLRLDGGDPSGSFPPATNEGPADVKGVGAFSESDSVGGILESRLGAEGGASNASLETLLLGPQQRAARQRTHKAENDPGSVETEAALALVITEEAPESSGDAPPAAPSTMEEGPTGVANAQAVVVPCFPPVSSLAVTSPLDPRRLSALNQPLAPYTSAAAPALQKSIPYAGFGGSPILYYPNLSGGPSSLRQSFERPAGPSPRQQMPSGFRGLRRIGGPFCDLPSPNSQGAYAASSHGSASSGPLEASKGFCGSKGGPVMSLADAAKRSARADAQHLRDAVEALQKSALAKLGTGKEEGKTARTPEESSGFSRITTMGAEPETEAEVTLSGDDAISAAPERGSHYLAILQLAWRRLRFRSSPTELTKAYVLAVALAVHFLHMAATGVYFFGLKSISFTVAWPQPFPSEVPAPGNSQAWAFPVNSFWFRGEDPKAAAASSLIVSSPLQGPGVGPSPAGTAVSKWAGLAHNLGGPSWCLLAVALSVPPLADFLCFFVGLWLFLTADTRQEQLFCMTVASTMPKHIVVFIVLLVQGASLSVAFFGILELVAMAAIKVLLCTLAGMYASRVDSPDPCSTASTKESELLVSIAQECEQAADICNCQSLEGCT